MESAIESTPTIKGRSKVLSVESKVIGTEYKRRNYYEIRRCAKVLTRRGDANDTHQSQLRRVECRVVHRVGIVQKVNGSRVMKSPLHYPVLFAPEQPVSVSRVCIEIVGTSF